MPDLLPSLDPKFVTGELVEIRDKNSKYFGKRFRVQSAIYQRWYSYKPCTKKGLGRQMWKFKLPVTHDGFSYYWDEHELIKLYANEECEWVDCIYNPSVDKFSGLDDEDEDDRED